MQQQQQPAPAASPFAAQPPQLPPPGSPHAGATANEQAALAALQTAQHAQQAFRCGVEGSPVRAAGLVPMPASPFSSLPAAAALASAPLEAPPPLLETVPSPFAALANQGGFSSHASSEISQSQGERGRGHCSHQGRRAPGGNAENTARICRPTAACCPLGCGREQVGEPACALSFCPLPQRCGWRARRRRGRPGAASRHPPSATCSCTPSPSSGEGSQPVNQVNLYIYAGSPMAPWIPWLYCTARLEFYHSRH